MTTVSCPKCKGKDIEELDWKEYGKGGNSVIWQCQTCKHIWNKFYHNRADY